MFKASEIERIRKLRKVPQNELVSKIGMTKGGYHNALKNNEFKTSVISKIAEILDVNVGVFFGEDDANSNVSSGNYINGDHYQAKKIRQDGGEHNAGGGKSIEKLENENKWLREKVSYLEQRLADKDEIIKQKDELIGMYKDRNTK